MVTVEELLFRQGQLETEVMCLQDALTRLTHRIFILESFIKHKHGELALNETLLLCPGPGTEKESEDYSFVGDFSDLFVANPDVGVGGAQSHEIIITTKPQSIKDASSNNDSQSVPDLSVGDVETTSDIEETEEQEHVPDAVREETVSVSGASVNVMDVSVYDGDSMSGQINLIGNDVGDYTEVVTYDVIPTAMVFDQQQSSVEIEDASSTLPPNKHAGTIRIYKPELKSFTRIPSGIEPSEDSTDDGSKHQCSVCRKVFLQKENLQRHMLLHSVVRFRCDECDRDFNNVHNLNLHKGKHQRQRERKEKADAEKQSALNRKADNSNSFKTGDFKCSYCDISFATKSRRTGHERTHTAMKPFVCEICGLSFRSKSGLADHTIGHSGQRSHLCHICPAGFLRSRNLLKHIRFVHSLVQIKTVLDGKRVVEFVSPELAEILVEQRKHNIESQESKAERATSYKTSNANNSKGETHSTARRSNTRSSNKNTNTRNKRTKVSDNSKVSSRKVEYLKRKGIERSAKPDKDRNLQHQNNSSEEDAPVQLRPSTPHETVVEMDLGDNEPIDQDILDRIKSELTEGDEDDRDL